jgi:hypothetical protein
MRRSSGLSHLPAVVSGPVEEVVLVAAETREEPHTEEFFLWAPMTPVEVTGSGRMLEREMLAYWQDD